MKVGILTNPKHARTVRAYGRLVAIFKRERITYRSATTTQQWPGSEQASQLVDWGADLIVVLGGDGTLRVSAPVLAAAKVPVLIVPTGTANVLSKHLGIRSVHHALQLVEEHLSSQAAPGCEVPVNEADCFTATGLRSEHFISLAGIGGDARAVSEHAPVPTALSGSVLGYAYGAGRALFAPLITARITDSPMTDRPITDRPPVDTQLADPQIVGLPNSDSTATDVWSVMASKTQRPAGPIPVFDHAKLNARDFEFLAVELTTTTPGGRLSQWARIAWDCVNRRPANQPAMHYWKGGGVSISLDAPAPVQLDGDLIGDCRRLDLRAGTTSLMVLTPN